MHTLSTWALLHFWHRFLLASSTCLTHSWAAHQAPCHCILTHSCSPISPHLQFPALHPMHQIPPLYTASETRIPIQAAFQWPLTMTWGPESVWRRKGYSQCQNPLLLIQRSLYFLHKPAGLSISLNLGILVKKCWFLLESTREKHLRRAIWSSQVKIWSILQLQHSGSHAEETTFFASGIGQGEGWSDW